MKHRNGTTRNDEGSSPGTEDGIVTYSSELKVTKGKLVVCELDLKKVEDSPPELIRIGFYGDFFLHPEEKIEEIEEKLSGSSIEELPGRIMEAFQAEEMELVGVGPEDFVRVAKEALKNLKD